MSTSPPGGALISDGRVVAPEVRGAGNPRTIEPQDAENSAETHHLGLLFVPALPVVARCELCQYAREIARFQSQQKH